MGEHAVNTHDTERSTTYSGMLVFPPFHGRTGTKPLAQFFIELAGHAALTRFGRNKGGKVLLHSNSHIEMAVCNKLRQSIISTPCVQPMMLFSTTYGHPYPRNNAWRLTVAACLYTSLLWLLSTLTKVDCIKGSNPLGNSIEVAGSGLLLTSLMKVL